MKMRHSSAGFTLIELIIVIVIIGILAGIAIPRFINQTTNARVAALNGLAGALNSGAMLIYAQAQAPNGLVGTTVTTADGTAVTVVSAANPYPAATAGGINSAVNFTSTGTGSFTFVAGGAAVGTALFQLNGATCEVTYTTTATGTPTTALVTGGC